MTFKRLKYIVANKRLYFSRADKFCDPLEGTFPISAVKLFSALKTKNLDAFLLKAQSLRKSVAANCWHMDNSESLDMWRRYTENGQGIVIRSTLSCLQKSLKCYTSDPIQIVKVQYITFPKAVLPPVLGFPFKFKDVSFIKERELRCIIYRANTINGKGISVPVDIDSLIGAIYISPFAAKHFQDSVRATIDKYCPTKPVFISRFTNPAIKR